ncbi:MAG: disulfide bond formation protein B [Novosphingobium sp.]|nr:disulfide bond formation protein B [Novosphingobium sp.]
MNDALAKARLLALAAPALLLGGAYVSQYGFGLYPCQMCWWQRYAHFAALAFAILAFARPAARAPVLLAALAIGVSGLIGGFHAGVEYGWWQGITACSTTAAAGGDPLQAILDAPLVRCDVAPWSLLGVSLAGWNFVFSLAAAVAVFLLAARKGRAGA